MSEFYSKVTEWCISIYTMCNIYALWKLMIKGIVLTIKKGFGTMLQENPGVKSGIGYFAKEFTLRL